MCKPRLWHFPYSHFSEKVRWALDYKHIPHRRTALPPGLHIPPALLRTGRRRLPVLLVEERAIADSTQIIAYLERHYPEHPLYPEDPALKRDALAWEDELDERYGPATRRLFLDASLACPEAAVRETLPIQPPFFELGLLMATPGLRMAGAISRGLDRRGAARARARVEKILTRIEAAIEGTGYLVGDRFTVADLTAASLSAPIMDIPEFPYRPKRRLPQPIRDLHARYADRPARQWVADIYARFRGKRAAVS